MLSSALSLSNNKVAIKTILIMIGVVVLLAAIKGCQIYKAIQEHSNFSPPPEAVTTKLAEEQKWDRALKSIGSLQATRGVVLSAEESGKVSKINFESGAKVEAGSLLVELDTSVEEANLKAAVALWEQAKANLARAQNLHARNANSQNDLDSAVATERSTAAAAESLKSSVARKKIIAPFAGRTGIRSVNVGQYLSPGSPVVPLYELESVYLNFMLPQQVLSLVKVGDKVSINADAYPTENFEGKITTINPQVDQASRNIEIQALLPNPNEKLRPGMFAQVTLYLSQAEEVLVVPSSSVISAPFGDSVYVVEKSSAQSESQYNTVKQEIVKLGEKRGDLVSIISGIKAGDEVVSSGAFKLRPGIAVTINNSVSPSSQVNPNPPNT